MTNTKPKHYTDAIAVLVIFAIFAIAVISVILLGAKTYKRIDAGETASYNLRTSLQYLSTKVRSAKSPDCVSIVDFDGLSALRIDEEISGKDFCTYIYSDKGWIKEFFASADAIPSPEVGERLIEVNILSFSRDGRLIKVELETSAGERQTLYLSLSGPEAAA